MSRRLVAFLAAVYVAGALAFVWGVTRPWPPSLFDAAVFILVIYLSEWFAIEMPRGGFVGVSFAGYVAAMMLFGPAVMVVAAVIGALNPLDLSRRRPAFILGFNAAQVCVASVLTFAAFSLLGGVPATWLYAAGQNMAIAPLVAAASLPVYFAVNTGLTATAIGLSEKRNPVGVWLENARWQIANYAAIGLLGILMAATYVAAGVLGVLLLVVPLFIARQTFAVYMRRRDAYYETVHSLVAAIEAKDPYTRGHSERVAEYSERAAEELGLGSEEIDRLRFAALLHDLGKIGVDRRILNKPGKLTDEEYAEIKEHPDLAARILGDIEFLKPSVPSIRSHHERIDGGGYGQGIEGSQIPLHGRILGVADAFDAMTSARPYRPPHSVEEAVTELLEHSGSQFDPRIVEVFIRALNLQDTVEATVYAREGQLNLEDAAH